MTALLRQAISVIEALPADEQDAIASRWLAEVEDERHWAEQFAATTDDQWDRLMAEVRRDLAVGGAVLLDEVLPLAGDLP